MNLTKEEKIKGIRFREQELLRDLEKAEVKKQRIDTMYTIYGLMGDCLEDAIKTPMESVDEFVKASLKDLKESDLIEIRQLRGDILNDIEVAIKTVFPDAIDLTKVETKQLTITPMSCFGKDTPQKEDEFI